MAFGKKKDKELELAVQAAAAELPAPPAMPDDPEEELPPLTDDEREVLSTAVGEADASPEAAVESEPDVVASAADGGDALLSMFDTGELETSDLSAVVALAGDVDLDDLLEELQTVAAALGISTAELARAA